jgi:hypothetical protein
VTATKCTSKATVTTPGPQRDRQKGKTPNTIYIVAFLDGYEMLDDDAGPRIHAQLHVGDLLVGIIHVLDYKEDQLVEISWLASSMYLIIKRTSWCLNVAFVKKLVMRIAMLYPCNSATGGR